MRSVREFLDDFLNQTILFGYDRIGFSVRKKLWDPCETESSMEGKVCLITGANSGLGRAAAFHIAKLGATVYLICRNPESGEATLRDIVGTTENQKIFLEVVDTSEPQWIQAFAQRFRLIETRLDILINNAGVLLNHREENSMGIEKTFATNTLGYFLMTHGMLPLLLQSKAARIINVSSGGMYGAKLQIEDPEFKKRVYNGVKAYAESKRAEVILSELWAHFLRSQNIFVSAMHPGWVDTKGIKTSLPMFHKMTKQILRTPEEGADTIIWLATSPQLQKDLSGLFWFDRKPRDTHRSSKTKPRIEEVHQLWDICYQYVNRDSPLNSTHWFPSTL